MSNDNPIQYVPVYSYIVRTSHQKYIMEPVQLDLVRKQVRLFVQDLFEKRQITQVERNDINRLCKQVVNERAESNLPDDIDEITPDNADGIYVNTKGQVVPFHKTWEYHKMWRQRKKNVTN